MNIIGLHDGHNSNAALIENGCVVAAVDDAFSEMRKMISSKDLKAAMRGPVGHSGFERLTV
jgi:predicted NodU family carbamoyl transferase